MIAVLPAFNTHSTRESCTLHEMLSDTPHHLFGRNMLKIHFSNCYKIKRQTKWRRGGGWEEAGRSKKRKGRAGERDREIIFIKAYILFVCPFYRDPWKRFKCFYYMSRCHPQQQWQSAHTPNYLCVLCMHVCAHEYVCINKYLGGSISHVEIVDKPHCQEMNEVIFLIEWLHVSHFSVTTRQY